MICEKAMELMSAELDGEITEQERQELRAHLDRCEDCRRVYAAMASVDERVAALEVPAPAGLKQGVMYRINQESGKIKPAKRRFFGVGTGFGIVAAVLVLLIGTGLIRQPGSSSKPGARGENLASMSTSSLSGRYEQDAQAPANEPQEDANLKGMISVILPSRADAGQTMESGSPESAHYGYEGYLVPESMSDSLRTACGRLSEETGAPVLCYAELSWDGLLGLLKQEAPELAERLADCEPDREDGLLCCPTDWETALALQEWLLAVCPGSGTDSPDEGRLTERMEALDPGSEVLYRVITFRDREPGALPETAFPADWPAGWSERLLQAESWALIFPAEDFVPAASDPAWLVFPADD